VTGGRRRKCAENQNTSGITLALANYSNSVGNNAYDMLEKLSGKAIGKEYRLEKYTACGWMQTCLEVVTEHVEC
jgi:hypothetical protein